MNKISLGQFKYCRSNSTKKYLEKEANKLLKEAKKLIKNYKLKIIKAQIICHLYDKYNYIDPRPSAGWRMILEGKNKEIKKISKEETVING